MTPALKPIETLHVLVHPGFSMNGLVVPPAKQFLPTYRAYFKGLLEVVSQVEQNDCMMFSSGELKVVRHPAAFQQHFIKGFEEGESFDVYGPLYYFKKQLKGRFFAASRQLYDQDSAIKNSYIDRRLAHLGFAMDPTSTRCRVYGESFNACVLDHALGVNEAYNLNHPSRIVTNHTDLAALHHEFGSGLSMEDYLRKNIFDVPPSQLLIFRRDVPDISRVEFELPNGALMKRS